MEILDQWTLAGLQALNNGNQPLAATIIREESIPNGIGGSAKTSSTIAETTCRVRTSQGTPQEKQIAERHQVVSMWVLSFAAGTAVQSDDLVHVGSTKYRVLEPFGPTGYDVRVRVACVEVP